MAAVAAGQLPGFFVGNITTNGQVRSDFIQYWDQITPENEGKWGQVEPTRDVYNWSGLDRAYNYAIQNNIPFKQHTFIWGAQAPSWINSLSASEQAAEIEEWIRDFCARYPRTAMIDVVNEAIPSHQPAAFARNAFGNNWIIRSFQLARQYCPNAILILNDYNVLSWDTDAFIQLATPVVNAGVVDALGEQAHGLESWSVADIQSRLNRVAALGLPIYITEYDVARTNDQEQLNIMQAQFPLFHDHPSVAGITLWGYVVGQHVGEWQRVDPKQRHAASGDDLADELPGSLSRSFFPRVDSAGIDTAPLCGGAVFLEPGAASEPQAHTQVERAPVTVVALRQQRIAVDAVGLLVVEQVLAFQRNASASR